MSEENKTLSRRSLLKGVGAASLLPILSACGATAVSKGTAGHVVVVGGGFGGATAAKYIKRGNPAIAVTLIEPKKTFYTCPFSNLVLAGERSLDSIGHNYQELKEVYGVEVVHAYAEDVDPVAHTVRLSTGSTLKYDRLVLSPGIDIRWDALEGYDQAAAELAPHAWQAGEQTRLLRRQLEAMDDGDTFILSAPANPFRCPPGPYERASLIAHYFSQHKPRSKVLILDSKDNFSKQGLFTSAWQEVYGDRIEWVGLSGDGKVVRVDAQKREVETEFGTRHKAGVLNVVPPQKAGKIAERAGVTNSSGWVPVNPRTFEAELAADIYVVGDATVAAPMPKSGFAANAQGKVAAAAIVASLEGTSTVDPHWANTCYSLINPDYGISVAGVYRLENNEIVSPQGSGGLSASDADGWVRRAEAEYAVGWYNAISQDTWGTRL
ncbi:sulfide dehydrogenase (flavocytochrome c), flavoprotein subunit [Marinospirillum celere]|uniref:Sulfide dehydrogenase (Flavocytochrome c), flavoprotein subunit n=1 Tax=Marinospirillum celere TaxID=1122252 RepID=A0A1I1FGT0_9GAMM|nr:NAD(P)/FAD-dependent oxidoreductase [Marinospirillum celere]SFB98491.1 sulfide dehydrogenase (flavocytochrome c), flavoprotein subunit [Marinospirillum celere]